jgi:hypothetical protein
VAIAPLLRTLEQTASAGVDDLEVRHLDDFATACDHAR